jgi:hypothetical protein
MTATIPAVTTRKPPTRFTFCDQFSSIGCPPFVVR